MLKIILTVVFAAFTSTATIAQTGDNVSKRSDIDVAIDFLKLSPKEVRKILVDDFVHESPFGKFKTADDFDLRAYQTAAQHNILTARQRLSWQRIPGLTAHDDRLAGRKSAKSLEIGGKIPRERSIFANAVIVRKRRDEADFSQRMHPMVSN